MNLTPDEELDLSQTLEDLCDAANTLRSLVGYIDERGDLTACEEADLNKAMQNAAKSVGYRTASPRARSSSTKAEQLPARKTIVSTMWSA